ncbi:MAG: response regulator [Sphaerochaeta sp.]|uniref:response regulator transcription factor n=1 Tax=Sphaerochaeta sp. TaxID=1972642 RepID=UPI003D0C8B19
MYKLLIVDDEPNICENIKTFIDWKALDVEVLETCNNGIDALNSIIDEGPDIVLTDIKMPGLSGLDLVQKIYDLDRHISVILLSGYDDFSFAKTAMRFGIRHYLLKPCNEKEIISAIIDVIDEYEKRSAVKFREQTFEMLVERFSHVFFREIMMNVIPAPQRLHAMVNLCKANILQPYDEICIAKLHGTDPHRGAEFTEIALNVLVKAKIKPLLYPLMTSDSIYIFFQPPADKGPDFATTVLRGNSIIRKNDDITVNVSNPSSLEETLRNVVDEFNDQKRVWMMDHPYSYTVLYEKDDIYNVYYVDIDDNLGDIDTLRRIVSDFFSRCSDLEPIRKMAMHVISQLLISQQLPFSYTVTSRYTAIQDAKASEEIIHITNLLIDDYAQSQVSQPKQYSAFISRTIEYVEKNYMNSNISLKQIARDCVFFNVDYLSRQFRKQTGMKFSQYLTSVRMEKAKRLIETMPPDLPIYQIAESVGCGDNSQYFSQMFKKFCGLSPTEYYKQIRINQKPQPGGK